MMKSFSVFHIEQKMVFEMFNRFFVDSFGKNKSYFDRG